jgi:hypothetical protein
MQVIEVGNSIIIGTAIDHSETYRVSEGKASYLVLETTMIALSGTTPVLTVTVEQSSDLVNWSTVSMASAHTTNTAIEYKRTESPSPTSPNLVLQPYLRLKYTPTGTSTKFLFNARLTVIET